MFSFTNKKKTRQFPVATRVVKTSRWIHRNELKVGMYVRELDRPWEETSFMFQGFVIDSVDLLHNVQEEAEYICIESEKLSQVPANSPHRLCGAIRG